MKIKSPDETVLYIIEDAVKTYRKLAQSTFRRVAREITLDQALLLIMIQEHPEENQKTIASKIFKDNASVSRIIDIMVKKGYLDRIIKERDKRQSTLTTTKLGNQLLTKLKPVIKANRQVAMQGLREADITQLENTINIIKQNCMDGLISGAPS